MDYEATISSLIKRIEELEAQVRRLEVAHLPHRANTKGTETMLKACYDAGIAAAFDQNAEFNDYTEEVCLQTGMSAGTARILIMTAYALRQGKLFKCIISGKTAAFFLGADSKRFWCRRASSRLGSTGITYSISKITSTRYVSFRENCKKISGEIEMKAISDVHVHNFLSNCSRDRNATAENYIKRYAELGIKILGFANHTWDDRVSGNNNWYHKQNLNFEMQIKNQIPEDTLGVKVLVGAETEFCGMTKTLGMTAEGAKELDFLLIPHSHVHMRNFVMKDIPEVLVAREKIKRKLIEEWGINQDKAAEMAKCLKQKDLEPFFEGELTDYPKYVADFLVQSFEDLIHHPELEKILKVIPVSIAHPFQPVGDEAVSEEIIAHIPDETFHRLFKMAAERGIGLEINTGCNTPQRLRFNRIAMKEGCKFTLGSDTHSIQGAENIFRTEETLEALGLTEENLMDFIRI